MILKIASREFWKITPENDCEHEYEDDDIFEETDYSGSYLCIHCGSKLNFDVADIGD